MKLFSAAQVREWDQYTISHEPIASIDLMERAAVKCVEWIEKNGYTNQPFHIFCGKGNNGGDGLAIARLLTEIEALITVHILEFGHKGTDDFQANLARLHQYPGINIRFIQHKDHFQVLEPGSIVIDALFGSGLNRRLEGVTANLVEHLNSSGCTIISIDIPSGLFTDHSSAGNTVINATHTLTFQTYKLAMLVAGNASYIGHVHVLDIGLHTAFCNVTDSRYQMIDGNLIRKIYQPRNQFGHKGIFGHAMLIAGSYGKMGAAVLSAQACMRSGVGLLTCHIPRCGYDIMQSTVPEAMVVTDFNTSFNTRVEDAHDRYAAIGIGPGIGTASETRTMLKDLFYQYKKPMVIDADAINIMGADRSMMKGLPANSVITPHPKEFERLFGESANDFERIELAIKKSKELNVVIVLKGHYTFVALPSGAGFFNPTGNAGMATGGSGDVLTGIITGLLAQSYSSENAALLGVYLHGLAGDIAAERLSMESMIASDIIHYLKESFISIPIL